MQALVVVAGDVVAQADIIYLIFFFFQAEDGIRDKLVTGVQTCALPISPSDCPEGGLLEVPVAPIPKSDLFLSSTRGKSPETFWTRVPAASRPQTASASEIGRASCRERV